MVRQAVAFKCVIKWYTDISKLFSNIEDNPEVAFNDEFYNQVLNKKAEFENLVPEEQQSRAPHDTFTLNSEISYEEVAAAIDRAKLHKSFLEIPNEALKNPNAKLLLHKFYSICFETGLCPTNWYDSNIIPIPKKDKDQRDPLNNRCITIMCCISKIYSCILNKRMQKFLEANNILEDEQNHHHHIFPILSTITYIITSNTSYA